MFEEWIALKAALRHTCTNQKMEYKIKKTKSFSQSLEISDNTTYIFVKVLKRKNAFNFDYPSVLLWNDK